MSYCLFNVAPSSTVWWPIALPLFAGAAAIYLLLPRPRAYPVLWGAGLGLLGLVLTGVLLLPGAITVESILFWSFSALAILAGALLVTQHNPARAALAFALVVLSTCGLFLLLAAPFLMAATIIVYAGAIIVTFLFVIMLALQSGLSDADDRSREPLLTTITGFILLATLLFVLRHYDDRVNESTREIDRLIQRTEAAERLDSVAAMDEKVGKPGDDEELFNQFSKVFRTRPEWKDLDAQTEHVAISWTNIKRGDPKAMEESRARLKELIDLGNKARHRLGWLPQATDVPFSDMSGPPPTLRTEDVRRDKAGLPRMPADNAAFLGRSLFSDFLLPVELGGALLLAATVGAIAIAFRRS
jgi:NADH:ubiquinone oxidoreductase subunit 6 (subunit J)